MSTPELLFAADAPLTGHNTTWHLEYEGRPIDVKLERGDQPVSITALDTGRDFKLDSKRGQAIVALVLDAYRARFGDGTDAEAPALAEDQDTDTTGAEAIDQAPYVVQPTAQTLVDVFTDGPDGAPRRLFNKVTANEITPRAARSVALMAWRKTMTPGALLTTEQWLTIFHFAGYAATQLGEMRPRNPLTLYRGAHPRYACGMAWTPSLQGALIFARRQAVGQVYQAKVHPSRLLAHISDSHIEEYVVNPTDLDINRVKGTFSKSSLAPHA